VWGNTCFVWSGSCSIIILMTILVMAVRQVGNLLEIPQE
jgi:hypothetical protein